MSSAGKLLIASALAAVFATACTSTQIAPVSDNSTTGTIKSTYRPWLLPHPGTPTP